MDIGSMSQNMGSTSPKSFDDVLCFFDSAAPPETCAAFVSYAFSLNRVDATDAVALWIKANPKHWFHPQKMDSVSLEKPADPRIDNTGRACLLSHLILKPAVLSWFFEHQPHIKNALLEPAVWNTLLSILKSNDNTAWPCTAHRVFNTDIPPHGYRFNSRNYDKFCNLVGSYVHNPLAQCFLLYQDFNGTQRHVPFWMNTTATVDHFAKRLHACSTDDCLALNQEEERNLELLLVVASLALSPNDFYEQAKRVLTPDQITGPSFIDVDFLF